MPPSNPMTDTQLEALARKARDDGYAAMYYAAVDDPSDEMAQAILAALKSVQQANSGNPAIPSVEPATAANRESDASPAEDALNWLWRDLILSRNPNYGDWEYPAQAYRHIICEVNDRIAAARADAALPICDTPTEGGAAKGSPVSQGIQKIP